MIKVQKEPVTRFYIPGTKSRVYFSVKVAKYGMLGGRKETHGVNYVVKRVARRILKALCLLEEQFIMQNRLTQSILVQKSSHPCECSELAPVCI